MTKIIKILHKITGSRGVINIEAIDEASYNNYVRLGWLPDESDLGERKRARDDNWGLTPIPSDRERSEQKIQADFIRAHAALCSELRKAGFAAGRDFFLSRSSDDDFEIGEAAANYLLQSSPEKLSNYLLFFKALKNLRS